MNNSNTTSSEKSSAPADGDEIFNLIIRNYYFPFIKKYCKIITLSWVFILVICAIYGPQFLSLTKSNLSLPPSTESYKALQAFKDNFPYISAQPPIIIVAQSSKEESVLNGFTRKFSTDLKSVCAKEWAIQSVVGYWELRNSSTPNAGWDFVSSDNRTMETIIGFVERASYNDAIIAVREIMAFVDKHSSSSNTKLYCTGSYPLFQQMSEVTATGFELIDAVVLPIGLLILGYYLGSYRHIGVTILVLLCSLLLAFAILVPITKTVSINPLAPSIMLSLGIAICFDYSLFLLTRFREELYEEGKDVEEAVLASLCASGHVVVLSGTTLLITFAILTLFPQDFLISVGFGCGAVVVTSMFVNITLTPSILLTFNCLSRFDMFPSSNQFCCWVRSSSTVNAEKGNIGSATVVVMENESITKAVEEPNLVDENGQVDAESKPSLDLVDKPSAPISLRAVNMGETAGNSETVSPIRKKKSGPLDGPPNVWLQMALLVMQHSRIVIVLTLGITAPLLWQYLLMNPASDDQLIYLRGSSSLKGLQILQNSFPIGQIAPYQVITVVGQKNSIFTKQYFDLEQSLIHRILTSQTKFVDSTSIKAVSFVKGNNISYSVVMGQYMNRSSLSYQSSSAIAYRNLVQGKVNMDKSAALVSILTLVNPNSAGISPFINSVRSLLKDFSHTQQYTSGSGTVSSVKGYLFGGYTTSLDVQLALYALVPIMIGATLTLVIIVIGFSFRSVFLAVRLLITLAISLVWTYGFLSIVYQPGPGQDAFMHLTPELRSSTGVYWIIPIMSFSVLVGLALDYDIFLMSRFIEYRRRGWSDRMAICLAVGKTGGIITAAGLIMAVSFGGLLILPSTVLNQYGFSLFLGVVIDTFFVRTILVPAVITVLDVETFKTCIRPGQEKFVDQIAWWPAIMPHALLDAQQEIQAVWAGFREDPAPYLEMLVAERLVEKERSMEEAGGSDLVANSSVALAEGNNEGSRGIINSTGTAAEDEKAKEQSETKAVVHAFETVE